MEHLAPLFLPAINFKHYLPQLNVTAFIFRYLLIIAAIASGGISEIQPAQAQSLPDVSVPQ
jgi:hypothetical protein